MELNPQQLGNARRFFQQYLNKAYNECKQFPPNLFHDVDWIESEYNKLIIQYDPGFE